VAIPASPRAAIADSPNASSMKKIRRFVARKRSSCIRTPIPCATRARSGESARRLAPRSGGQGNRLGAWRRALVRVDEVADAVVAPVLDRDKHHLPRQGVGWLDLVKIRQCREQRLAPVVDLEERLPVRCAAREKALFVALCGRRILAVEQEIPR